MQRLLIASVLSFVLGSCSARSVAPSMQAEFLADVGIADLNQSIQLGVVGPREYQLGSDIEAVIQNRAGSKVVFSEGFALKILAAQGGRWVSVGNWTHYVGDLILLPRSQSDYAYVQSILVQPRVFALPTTDGIEVLRLYVQGTMVDAQGTEMRAVGAYADFRVVQ